MSVRPTSREVTSSRGDVGWSLVRLVIARCSVDYDGRLTAHLPLATRLLLVKADGSVLVHSDGGSYKPLNWMSPAVRDGRGRADDEEAADGVTPCGSCSTPSPRTGFGYACTRCSTTLATTSGRPGSGQGRRRGAPPEAPRRAHPHPRRRVEPGPPRAHDGDRPGRHPGPRPLRQHVAIEIKRRGEIDGVEQLTRYLELMNRDPHLAPVVGVFAAQEIKPQARVLAEDRRTLSEPK